MKYTGHKKPDSADHIIPQSPTDTFHEGGFSQKITFAMARKKSVNITSLAYLATSLVLWE
jgi:hypothetical protein